MRIKRKEQQEKQPVRITLGQLLAGAAVVVVLSAVWLCTGGDETDRARETARADLATLQQALDMYALSLGELPAFEDGLEALVYDPGKRGWDGPYLPQRKLPRDPWGNCYRYEPQHERHSYTLVSPGPDGVVGTGDDICCDGQRV